jgi:inosine-uridine nucleoside N-ribohydrolase
MLVDCDPGVDHFVSLLYAARHFDLVQVTTVHGNAGLRTTTRNAMSIVSFANIDVPVAAGCDRGIIECRHSAEMFHGDDALGGAGLPQPQSAEESRHAVQAIIETAHAHQGDLVVACLGPLTNLALALRIEPRIAGWIKLVTLMGGSHGIGHMTPTAEFNFWCDPEAAAIVCGSPVKTRVIGYEVTRTLGFSRTDIARMANSGHRIADAIARVFAFNLERQRNIWGLEYAPIHSTMALVPLIKPNLSKSSPCSLAIELIGTNTRGMSVYDLRTLKLADTAPFEYLPQGSVERITWVDPAAIAHVIDTILTYN